MNTLRLLTSSLRLLVSLWLCVQPLAAQTPADAVVADPPADPAYPATMAWPDIPSHGNKLYSVIYIASGAGPHPTVLMLHGFPGNEKNLDLAYSLRRAGWNVLVPFYRGAWGSGGAFSFTHALEDAQVSIDCLRESENAKKFRIDSSSNPSSRSTIRRPNNLRNWRRKPSRNCSLSITQLAFHLESHRPDF